MHIEKEFTMGSKTMAASKHSMLSLIFITCILVNRVLSVSVGSHDCTAYDVIDGVYYCFELHSNSATFKEAEALCRDQGGSLPVVMSPEVNDLLVPIARRARLTWLALVQHTRPWRWGGSHSEPEVQGCYIRNERDFDNPVTLRNMTQDICKNYCKGQGARYAALRNGKECYCSKYFHIDETETGNVHPCNVLCPGNYDQHCGSESHSVLVFSLYGTSSHWGSDQPNEHLSYQSCALADADHSYWWNDVKCKEPHGALCYKEAPAGLDLSRDTTFCRDGNVDSFKIVNRTCFMFFTDRMTWFKALTKCTEVGAKLFEPSRNEDLGLFDTLRHHMDRNHRNASPRAISFWIRLFKREWTWNQGGAERTLLYSNWNTESPSSEKQNCSAINEQGEWEDAECDRNYPFVCQFDNLTSPITRPPTTFPTILKNTLRPLAADPQRREPFSFKKHGIWLILAGSILLVFIMVFITVAYCRYCHRVKKERKKFTLYYGIDVGSGESAKESKKDAAKNNLAYLDATALPMHNGVNGAPRIQNDYSGDPEYAEYGYTGTIEQTKPIKPSLKKKSKYRQSHEY